MNHDQMMEITKEMPMRQIDVNGKPYLQRYFAGTTADDYDIFIHRFLSADGDEHLHSHPRDSYSYVVVGEYIEQCQNGYKSPRRADNWFNKARIYEILSPQFTLMKSRLPEFAKHITVFDWHRIAQIEPGTWSLFIVGPDVLPFWYFVDSDGVFTAVKSSPRDWWKSCKPRIEAEKEL